jgi:hypothetical protein
MRANSPPAASKLPAIVDGQPLGVDIFALYKFGIAYICEATRPIELVRLQTTLIEGYELTFDMKCSGLHSYDGLSRPSIDKENETQFDGRGRPSYASRAVLSNNWLMLKSRITSSDNLMPANQRIGESRSLLRGGQCQVMRREVAAPELLPPIRASCGIW